MTAAIVIGMSSGLFALVLVCAVNLVLRYAEPVDVVFLRWCGAALALAAVLGAMR